MSRSSVAQRKSRCLRGLAAVLFAATSLHASAALVTTRVGLAGTDSIDWGQLGAPFDETAGSAAAVTTSSLLSASVSKPSGTFLLFDEASYAGNLGGNILFTNFTPGPISIDFNVGLSKIGAQIQANEFGAFNGMISVFDAANALLESWSFAGDSNGAQNNSAIFIGVSRLTADIDRVEFSITFTDPTKENFEFAINGVDLTAGGGGNNGVPEPTSLALVGLSLFALARSRRRTQN